MKRFRLSCLLWTIPLVIGAAQSAGANQPAAGQAANTVRSSAVVDLGFDEAEGSAQSAGSQAVSGELKNGAQRVDSPFWGQEGKRAILLNAARKQTVQIADGPAVDRPAAVTLSFFYLSLHPLNDPNFHGIVAKRAEANTQNTTNYGINYHPKNDALQFYINDGSGFRTVVYSVKDILETRRLVHLTATWEVGDAPGADADTDADDVRVRLFVNGQSVAPKTVPNGQIVEHDGWMPNINVAKLLNDVPVTLGSSTLSTEFASGLIDEFLLFDRALTPEEAGKLFVEVAGPKGSELAKQEIAPVAAANPKPAITSTSLHGLEAGKTARLSVMGSNLSPNPQLVLPGVSFEQKILEGSNPGRLNAEIVLPENSPLGWFPLYVETEAGLSNPLAVAIDTLPQRPAAGSSPDKPAALPAAFSGQIAGANIIKIYFQGKAGERIAAEVEAKRLGSAMDPVVEIKSERGTPVVIAWGESVLRGDARAECRLPHDGLYFVELHDLTYKAPGQNRFRLKVGDFRSVDQWFPAKVAPAEKIPVKALGSGLPADSALELTGKMTPGKMVMPKFMVDWPALGPVPALEVTQAEEVMESAPKEGLQTVDATFRDTPHLPVVINGIVVKESEEDRYLLNVTPGKKLRFRVEARSLPSPLDALFTVQNHPGGNILLYKEDSGAARDPEAEFAVPANISQIQVGVQDLHERGGERFVYRLKVQPADAPDFDLQIKSPQVVLPKEGSAIVEMTLNRRGYNGPIRLKLAREESISLIPAEIPAGAGNRELFVTLVSKAGEGELGFRGLTIQAESVGLKPEIVRTAEVAAAPGAVRLPGFASLLPAMIESSAPFQIEASTLPQALFKGVPANVKVNVKRHGETGMAPVVRLSLLTTEPTRPNDPKDPKKGDKPKIRSQPGQAVGREKTEGTLRIAVPTDVAVAEIDAVIKAELVPHAYSDKVAGVGYSHPFKIPIKTAASVTVDDDSLKFTAGMESPLKGTINRTAAFNGPLTLSLAGLPAGYQAGEITVPAGQSTFEIPIKPGPETAPKTIKANLQVKFRGRTSVLPDVPVMLKVSPAN